MSDFIVVQRRVYERAGQRWELERGKETKSEKSKGDRLREKTPKKNDRKIKTGNEKTRLYLHLFNKYIRACICIQVVFSLSLSPPKNRVSLVPFIGTYSHSIAVICDRSHTSTRLIQFLCCAAYVRLGLIE